MWTDGIFVGGSPKENKGKHEGVQHDPENAVSKWSGTHLTTEAEWVQRERLFFVRYQNPTSQTRMLGLFRAVASAIFFDGYGGVIN